MGLCGLKAVLFQICTVLGAEAVSSPRWNITRLLKYAPLGVTCCLLDTAIELQGLFLQCQELIDVLVAINYISQTTQHKQNQNSFIYLKFNQTHKIPVFHQFTCL